MRTTSKSWLYNASMIEYHEGVAVRAEWSSVSADMRRKHSGSLNWRAFATSATAWPCLLRIMLRIGGWRQPPRIWPWDSRSWGQNGQKGERGVVEGIKDARTLLGRVCIPILEINALEKAARWVWTTSSVWTSCFAGPAAEFPASTKNSEFRHDFVQFALATFQFACFRNARRGKPATFVA